MEKTFDIVRKAAEKSRIKQKSHFDKKANAKKLSIGEQVLLRILTYEGKHKIGDKYEGKVYFVKSQPYPDIPVFLISDKNGVEKTVHRNLIIPTGTRRELTDVRPDTSVRRKTEKKSSQIKMVDNSKREEGKCQSSDSDEVYMVEVRRDVAPHPDSVQTQQQEETQEEEPEEDQEEEEPEEAQEEEEPEETPHEQQE
ncbi:putative uncharacterized protein DDB_G0287113 [Saccostrea cucullata]|uniref:putative uncharacterized protein DDB_G0287113 n=1 Tax=Saccostrea cuccullata TaxID=36930 RepID=UPI002ED584AF